MRRLADSTKMLDLLSGLANQTGCLNLTNLSGRQKCTKWSDAPPMGDGANELQWRLSADRHLIGFLFFTCESGIFHTPLPVRLNCACTKLNPQNVYAAKPPISNLIVCFCTKNRSSQIWCKHSGCYVIHTAIINPDNA
jgi:hypothetical protein